MIWKIYVLILLTVLGSNLFAQSPGFQGKRTFAEYNFNYMLAVQHPNTNNKTVENNGLAFSYRHNLKLSYNVSRRNNIGIDFDHFNTGANLTYQENDGSYLQDFSTVKVSAYGLHIDNYFIKKGALAPYGFYSTLGSKYVVATPENSKIKYKTSAINTYLGLGVRKIFFKKIIFNFSGNLSWTWGSHKNNVRSEKEIVQQELKDRIFSHYLFENSIGIGILLF